MSKQRKTRLTPEEQKLKEQLIRSSGGTYTRSPGKMPENFHELSETREGRRVLIKQLASSGQPEDIKPGRSISEEFWQLPKPKDPEGLLLKALLEDREQGR